MVKEFVKFFTKKNILEGMDIALVRGEYYSVTSEQRKLLPKSPFYIGQYLGRRRGKDFFPSLFLLNLLAKESEKKISINDKGEWLFICGRDLFAKSIVVKHGAIGELVLVLNKYEECLGYGSIIAKFNAEHTVVKNLFDIGDFLRRERKN